MIGNLLNNPIEFLQTLALRLPAVLIAICMHESAHAWMANRCGDPTGKLYGRISLNPMRHFDLVGMLFMFFIGFGWAKPVPVNPMNYRNYRRDDLKVSLAGIITNLLIALVSVIGICIFFTCAFISFKGMYYLEESDVVWYQAVFWNPLLVADIYGTIPGYLYQILCYMATVNLSLAIFNLIPLPPLDGYHVLNDLVLKRPLFADQRATMTGYSILMFLMITGWLSDGINFVFRYITNGIAVAAYWIVSVLGVI